MMTLCILCLVLLLYLYYGVFWRNFGYRRRRMYRLAALIKSSKDALPCIGTTHRLFGNTQDIMSTLQRFSHEANNNNGIIKTWNFSFLYFVCTNPRDLKILLRVCLEKDGHQKFLRNISGNGGIFASVQIWRPRRKILVPAFSPKIVESYVEIFSEQSLILVKRLAERANSQPFNIWPYLSSYTFDSVGETTMGVKLNSQTNHDEPFLKALNSALHLVCERIFHPWLAADWMYKMFTNKYNEHQMCIQTLHSFTQQVIQKKRQKLNQERNQCSTEPEYGLTSYHRKTFLELLIDLSSAERGYSDVELREEVLTLLIAGTDTSALATGYTLQLLAKYPHVQEKVYQELYDVFGESGRPLEKQDLMQLFYLERVIKESLRLFPPAAIVSRKILQEITLPSGVTLPAGCSIIASIWGAHRDPKYWGANADHFDPDRFLPERFNLAHTCSYMPFSSGPRNCVGFQFAQLSVKAAVSSIVRHYRVVGEPERGPCPHIPVKLDILMKPVDGYQLALEIRRGKSTDR